MADIGSLFCNKVLQKQSAQKNESLEWLDFVSSISDFCWIFCTCHYGLDDMGYVAFWMMPKGNEKRETQQNPMPLPPARSEKGNKNRGNPRNPLPHSCFPQKGRKRKRPQTKRPQTTGQPHLGAAALFYILSAITADHIFSKSSEFSRMDPTSLRWRNRGSKC